MPLYKKIDVNNESTINEPLLESTIEKATTGNVRTSGTRLVQKNIVVRCLPNIYYNTIAEGEGPIFNNSAVPEYCRTNLSVQVIWNNGISWTLNNGETISLPAGSYQTLNDSNNFVIKYRDEIQKTTQGTLLDNITYDGEEIYFPGESKYTDKAANFNGGFYFFLGIIHDITYSAQSWYPRITKHHTGKKVHPKIVKDDNAIQHFLFVTSGTVNISEGGKQRNFKKESCLLLQKNKEYTISQIGDEIMNVYEFKSVKKAATN
tara:strand:- start:200 stop:985 length:786 start_codon:yes stop_codon:yes gene_type:complete